MDNLTKKKLLKKTILLCWFALISCTIIYLCGGSYFNVIIENKSFIDLCSYIDGSFWKYVVKFIFANLSFYLYTASIIGKDIDVKRFSIIEVFIILDIVIKYINPAIGFIGDCILLLVIPFVLCMKEYKLIGSCKRVVIGFALLNAFQLVSILIKNIGIGVLNTNIVVELALQIDYYIMLILYYLYSVKLKGEKK